MYVCVLNLSAIDAVAIVAGGGSGPIQIAHLECTGDELRISDCPLPDFGLISLQCSSHVNDAGVVCTPGKYVHMLVHVSISRVVMSWKHVGIDQSILCVNLSCV